MGHIIQPIHELRVHARTTARSWTPRWRRAAQEGGALDRYTGGTFVGYTATGSEVLLAAISDDPSLRWNLLNVTNTTKVTSVRYNSPDGGFGNIAEIEVYGRTL